MSVSSDKPVSTDNLTCPHCNSKLSPFEMPPEMAWEELIHYACFNNDCPYFKKGWHHMWEQYEMKSSYRYRVTNAETGASSPLMVWSEEAIINRIIPDK